MFRLNYYLVGIQVCHSMTPERIRIESEAIFERVKLNREHLHAFPELSFEEYHTMEFIASELERIGIPFQKGVGVTGVVGEIASGANPTDWIAFRADIDALPIFEQNEVPYASKNEGVMHACGHDVHTSVLLGAAEILWQHRETLPVSVKLIFQPGEEVAPGGANFMIEAGVLENPKVKQIFALHVYPEMNVGKIGIRPGLYMASSDELHIEIEGVGGHAALPHKCVNPVTVAAEIIHGLPAIVKQFEPENVPTVLSFGRVEALGSTNVIPGICKIEGTFRTMNEPWRKHFFEETERYFATIERSFGAKIKFNRVKGYPFLVNDEALVTHTMDVLKNNLGTENVETLPLRMTADDFAFYCHLLPSCYFRLGVADPLKKENFAVHHPKFDIHPDALKVGVSSIVSIVFNADC